ncbi:hypothetical protein GTW43_23475 [Streptomyces sp. SID5785]|uniref:ATP-binding protein n=1 Tax=Streptomyces sp. SID5785 TaxID=2690309 RepID=UPI001361A1AA|nr:ATP-binding protein [Streptomyces sp. SID5785]MZD08019.1 hypothetical protein [Streptomyces sp. SID5785]
MTSPASRSTHLPHTRDGHDTDGCGPGPASGAAVRAGVPLPRTIRETQDLAWWHVTRHLPCDEQAPHRARAYVSSSFSDWDLPDDITGALIQIVSELVTNSVRHTPSAKVSITVALSDHLAWVGVTGRAGTTEARVRAPSTDAESGRGLLLVDALTTWWSTTTAHGRTDVVAAVALDGHEAPAGAEGTDTPDAAPAR